MYVSDFEYHRPKTVAEACQCVEDHPDGAILAGGTDLLVDLKLGKRHHPAIISLADIPELQLIERSGDQILIGACVTHNGLMDSPVLQEHCPALVEAAATIGTEQIRNAATVGGNLVTAASCADTAPMLIALEANVVLTGVEKGRTMPLSRFFTDHRTTALEKGEILTRIKLPIHPKGTGAAYKKFGLRQAANISVASVAARIHLVNDICEDACFVMGAVAPTPKTSQGAVALVKGRSPGDVSPKSIGEAVAAEAEPIDDIRGSATFRRELTAILAERAFSEALDRAKRSAS
jgi:CO/xanthine dehydrogenase FAD-binding subunit